MTTDAPLKSRGVFHMDICHGRSGAHLNRSLDAMIAASKSGKLVKRMVRSTRKTYNKPIPKKTAKVLRKREKA